MAAYNGIDEKISKIKNGAVQKTKDVSETMRITSAMKSEEERQEKLFRNIGQVCFDKGILEDRQDLQHLYAELSECQMRIKEYKERLNVLKGMITCPKCGKSVSSTEKFCSYCGEKLISAVSISRICPACKKENANNAKFCTGCGTRLVPETEQKDRIYAESSSRIMVAEKATVTEKMLIAAAVLQILMAFLWFVDVLEIEGFGVISRGYSVHTSFGEYRIASYITVILCLAAVGLTLSSLMNFDSAKRYRMLFQIVITSWCFLMFFALVSGGLMEISSNGYGELVSLKFKLGGWLYSIDIIALLVILIKINLKTKK